MVYNSYEKRRIIYHYQRGCRPPTIVKLLRKEENLQVTRVGVAKFLKRFVKTGSLSRRPGSGRPSSITPQMKETVSFNSCSWIIEKRAS